MSSGVCCRRSFSSRNWIPWREREREENTGWLFISIEARVSLLRLDSFHFEATETLEAVIVYDENTRLEQDGKMKSNAERVPSSDPC